MLQDKVCCNVLDGQWTSYTASQLYFYMGHWKLSFGSRFAFWICSFLGVYVACKPDYQWHPFNSHEYLTEKQMLKELHSYSMITPAKISRYHNTQFHNNPIYWDFADYVQVLETWLNFRKPSIMWSHYVTLTRKCSLSVSLCWSQASISWLWKDPNPKDIFPPSPRCVIWCIILYIYIYICEIIWNHTNKPLGTTVYMELPVNITAIQFGESWVYTDG